VSPSPVKEAETPDTVGSWWFGVRSYSYGWEARDRERDGEARDSAAKEMMMAEGRARWKG
jgi:hypothetical protein